MSKAVNIVLAWEWKEHHHCSVRVLASRATPDEYHHERCDENTFVRHTQVAEVKEHDGRWHARVWKDGAMNPIVIPDGKRPADFASQKEAEDAADLIIEELAKGECWLMG